MTTPDRFQIDPEGLAVLVRGLVGFAAVATAFSEALLAAAACLVGAVWVDAATGFLARRRGPKSPGTTALELPVDAACFVFAPIAFALAATEVTPLRLAALAVFFVAGVYRLARFSVEGLVSGRYTGLPVTYNGYLVPLLGTLGHYLPAWAGIIYPVGLLIIAALMATRRLAVPEV